MEERIQIETLERLSFHLFSYLRGLPGFQDLKIDTRPEVTPDEAEQWHTANAPFVLPQDLMAFLQISDGLSVRWKAESLQTEIIVGSFDLNCLNRIEHIDEVETLAQQRPSSSSTTASESAFLVPNPAENKTLLDADLESFPRPEKVAAFILERNLKVGDVALVYELKPDGKTPYSGRDPTIWFRDKSKSWHYVAANFTCYYRLLVVHLGILGWQYAFTPQGLDPLSVQWMRLYCPERLMLDTQFRNPATSNSNETGTRHGMTSVAPNSLLTR